MSHRFPIESSEPDAREGNIWASVALDGRCGRSKLAMWVDVMWVPLGRRAMIGVLAGLMLETEMLVCIR